MNGSLRKARSGLRRLARGERGVALLFTLGMLGLLLALALAFASDALSERKAASAANSQAVANLVARSALERVLGAASWYTQSNVSIGSGFYSHTKSGDANAASFDRLWELSYGSISPFTVGSGSYSADSGVNWQYVSNGLDSDSPGHELIGRFAYVLNYGSGGLLDPSACIDTSANEYGGGQSHSNVFGWELRRGVKVSEINLMNLNDKTNSTDYLSTGAGTKISFAANGGQLANGQRWLDFDTMFSSLGVTSSTEKANLRTVFQLGSPADPEAFWLGTGSGDRSKDPSKYYHRFNLARGTWNSTANTLGWPNDSTPYKESEGSYSREAFLKVLTTPAAQYLSSSDGAGGGVTWLANWRDAGEMGSVAACKYQVAANLMDFCGAGKQVTSGYVSSGTPVLLKPGTSPDIFNTALSSSVKGDWGTTAPEFIGLKKTPRLNEVNVVLEVCVTYVQTSSNPSRYRFTYTIVPTFQSAIIDLYGGSRSSASSSGVSFGSNSSAFLKTKISYQCQTSASTTTYSSWEEGYASALPAYTNGWSSGYSTATTSTGTTFTHTEEGFSDFNTKVAVNLKAQMPTPAVLNFDGNNVNYCVIEDPASLNTITFNLNNFQAGQSSQKVYFSFQVDDPRMNLKPSNWAGPATLTPATNGNYNNVVCMGQRANRNVTYNSSTSVHDQENNLDNYAPAYDSSNNNQHLSNSFIRNGTNPSGFSSEPVGMLSPWELGCVHRGTRWQTLNLSYYRDVDSDPAGGGSDYNSGDANILDQVKFTGDVKTYGKVNLNANSPRMLQALFANLFIPNTGNNNDPQDGVSRFFDPSVLNNGQFLTLSQAATWASNFITYRSAMTDGSLLTRAQIMASSSMREMFCQSFKGPKSINEHILAQFVNLCKAEPDQITLSIVAQSIKDVGTAKSASKGVAVYKDWDGSGSGASAGANDAGMIASGYKDPSGTYTSLPVPSSWPGYTISNCRKGVYENGADLITAERKFYVTLYWDSKVSKWRVLSLQCLVN